MDIENKDNNHHKTDKMSESTDEHHQVTKIKDSEHGFETTEDDLPTGYYRSISFWGTMVACGASFAAVVILSTLQMVILTSIRALEVLLLRPPF
jgi:hypothetical protein